MKYFISLLIFSLIIMIGIGYSKKSSGKDSAVPATYKKYCAQCHGADLRGGNAQSMVDGVWQFGGEKSYIFRNIKFGIPNLGMPSYERTLSDQEIDKLVDFLLSEEKRVGAEKPSTPDSIVSQEYVLDVEVIAESLEIPWSIVFINKNKALLTERPGRLRIIKNGELLDEEISGIPDVLHQGQGGLLDVAIDPDYDENGWIYLSYSHESENSGSARSLAMTRIVRGKIKDMSWTSEQVVYQAPESSYSTTRHHYGSRIAFDPQGFLYFSVGDRGDRPEAQDLEQPNGKIHRIYKDGGVPESNPFYDTKDALPTIYAYGTRNAQGLAVHPETGELWETEHGPLGGDELNLIKAGENYGWPEISYGKHYNGQILTEYTHKEGMLQPILYWKPSIAVCGLDFYSGNKFPKWNNRLLVGALKYEEVRLLQIEDQRVVHEQVIVKNMGRVRDVETSPDGTIYIVLNQPGKVIRLKPGLD